MLNIKLCVQSRSIGNSVNIANITYNKNNLKQLYTTINLYIYIYIKESGL